MTPRELGRVLGVRVIVPSSGDEHDCFYVGVPKQDGVSVLLFHGRVARVEVSQGSTATDHGVRIGDTEAAVALAYPSNLKTEPSHYDGDGGGHYMTLIDRAHGLRLRFETWEGKVASFYAGTAEAIQLVEGCS